MASCRRCRCSWAGLVSCAVGCFFSQVKPVRLLLRPWSKGDFVLVSGAEAPEGNPHRGRPGEWWRGSIALGMRGKFSRPPSGKSCYKEREQRIQRGA